MELESLAAVLLPAWSLYSCLSLYGYILQVPLLSPHPKNKQQRINCLYVAFSGSSLLLFINMQTSFLFFFFHPKAYFLTYLCYHWVFVLLYAMQATQGWWEGPVAGLCLSTSLKNPQALGEELCKYKNALIGGCQSGCS